MSDKSLSEVVNIDGLSLHWSDINVVAQSVSSGLEGVFELSKRYKLKDWLKLNSLFCVNQLFFEPILAPVSELGVVAVLDDSLGQLSLSLALKSAEVIHIASDKSEKEFCESLFQQHGLGNVRVLEFNSDDLDNCSFNTLVLARPASKYKHVASRLDFVLKTLISKSQAVVVIEENKYGLRRLVNSRFKSLKVIPMFSPYWWKKILSPKFDSIEMFGVLNGSTSIQMPRISLWAKGQLEGDKAHQSVFKRMLSSLPFFKFLLPGFVVTSGASAQVSWFERVLNIGPVKTAMKEIQNGYVKRVFAGNRGVTVVIYGNHSNNCVWRIASEKDGTERVRINAQALSDLSHGENSKASLIPSLMYQGEELGSIFSIEEMLPGNDCEKNGGDEIAIAWMNVLQSSMKVRRDYSLEIHAEMVASSVHRLKGFCDSQSLALLDEVNQAIEGQFLGKELEFVPLHGDLKEGNYLFGETGKLSAVIDWDMYCKECFPLVDNIIQLIYQNIKPYQDDGVSIFSHFVDSYVSGGFDESLNGAANTFNLSERDVHVIVLFSLLRVIDLQFVDALKTHRGSFNSMLTSLSIILEHIRQC